eukprot:TRINITY_DN986_c0_g1_i1.p1 TRINITY_DN986_c0_g1~~TRINITY_DN986_c0_g1_i1.p1  ORF type:complete len:1032 (+),score=248.54 TRINITY_DN986_c0_g1_i1:716-3811(+)
MIARIVLAVSFSVAAFQTFKNKRVSSNKRSGRGDGSTEEQTQEIKNEVCADIDADSTQKDKEEEEIKRVNSVTTPASRRESLSEVELLLPEFEKLLAGNMDSLSDQENKNDSVDDTSLSYSSPTGTDAAELERLRNLVKELEEREVKLEGELLEYYGMKEQETSIGELQRQLQIKAVEADMLNLKIKSLESQKRNLETEVAELGSTKKELDAARIRIKELQKQIRTDSSQTKEQLLKLKQQVGILQTKEKEASKKDFDIEKKLQNLKELDVEVVELRRANKVLQDEKGELTVKLEAANSQIAALSSMTESDMVAHAREEANNLRHANADLLKQVEGLQMNRFSEVEELVYLRWVNACLRFELRNYQAPPGKVTAKDLNKSLSPKSQEKAKQLMLQYAGPDLLSLRDRAHADMDFESVSSQPSTPSECDDFDDASIDSASSRYSNTSKKSSLIKKLKRWGRSKDDVTAEEGGYLSSSRRMKSKQRISKDSLESLILRNSSDRNAITTFGKGEKGSMGRTISSSSLDSHDVMSSALASPDRLSLPAVRIRYSERDSPLNNVAASFQVMSKSVGGTIDEKYPPFKERHKLAMEREKSIKEKAEQARAEKLSEKGGTFDRNIKEDVGALSQSRIERPTGTLPRPIKSDTSRKVFNSKGENGNDKSKEQLEQPKESEFPVLSKMKLAEIQKRPPRTARPPPKPSILASVSAPSKSVGGVPLPPPPPRAPPDGPGVPPPPPPLGGLLKPQGSTEEKVHRAPELVEFYQSLMKREAKKEAATMVPAGSGVADARNNMIGEIANRSTFLLSVKADVETQGNFVNSLATEVRAAAYSNIEDVVAFVNWLDEELSFLVDERAVLKHFDWPEGKADALREASFEYQDLKKLESEIAMFEDDPKFSCDTALKKMYSLLEKVEQSVYALLRTRDMAIARYREFNIPTDWLLDSGVVGKIKLASVQLARKYMKRVSSELENIANVAEKEPLREYLLLQGVRFAFRVHQFAGGFDAESMRAFEELRNRARAHAEERENAASAKTDV